MNLYRRKPERSQQVGRPASHSILSRMTTKARWCRPRISTVFTVVLCVGFILLLLGYLSGFGGSLESNKDMAENQFVPNNRHQKARKHGNKWDQMFNQQAAEEVVVCKQPKFSVNDDMFPNKKNLPPLDCNKKEELMTVSDNVVLFDNAALGQTKLSKCIYRAIDRVSDDHFQYSVPRVERDSANFGKRIKHDFFRIGCFIDDGKTKNKPKKQATGTAENEFENEYDLAGNDNADYDQLFAQIYPKEETLERLEENIPSADSLNMSVLILGLDSMSHLSYQRNLPKTYAYLKDTLGGVIMNGYNILGDGTAATVVPLLTGKKVTELPEVRRNQAVSGYIDQYPMIWTEFEHNGYVTLFAEDEPSLGMFNLRQRGFENEPTDHYMRPFWQAVWDSSVNSKSDRFCLGSRPKHQFTLNYIKDFFTQKKYGEAPRFGFGFMGELSHADNEPVQHIDKDLVQFLRNLNTNGQLDNTLLIVMGDHGARYSKVRHTIQGKLEERLPLMSFVLPAWFQRKHHDAMKNLKTNANRLTTAFDVYEMLLDLVNSNRIDQKPKSSDRGISLFKEIPRSRTCTSAGIEMHWCTCLSWAELPLDDTHIQKSAQEVMDHINRQVHDFRSQCLPLRLAKIVDGRRILPNEKVLKYFNSLDNDHRLPNFTKEMKIDVEYYQVTIVTAPNKGFYEATVVYDKRGWIPAAISSPYNIVSDISRIDEYGNQPYCIQDDRPELMKYCYCADYKSKSVSKTSRKPKFFIPDEDWLS